VVAVSVEERLSALENAVDDLRAKFASSPLLVRKGTRTCEWCGASLEGKKAGARYCSAAHRVAASKARRAA
jgi:hypothetical protein